ncbi:MAG: hypothetical protein KDE51_26630, partial [Anaerolineales bacterium]|nr:hypothetical protein [Anaerolineales bacterium]
MMKHHIFMKRWAAMLSLCTAFLILSSLLSAFTPTTPQNIPTLFLLPETIAPGGDLYLGGYNFPTNNSEMWLSGEIGDIPLNDLVPDGLGVVRQVVPIPADVPAGEYILYTGASEILAQRPLTILPAPTISFTPDEGPPGTVVEFEVTNLMTGTLQINYEGAPVVGPLSVGEGSYSGQFVVPHDRPDMFEAFVPLEIINSADGRPLGQSDSLFFVTQPSSTPPYIFTNVEFSSTNLEPGEFFNITGQIAQSGAGRGAVHFTAAQLSQMNIYVLWDTAGQPTFPINTTQPQISQDGTFEVTAAAPSIINGDMVSPVATGQIGLVLDMKDQQIFSNSGPAFSIFQPPPLIVKVVDKTTGDPISKAAVIINEGRYGGQVAVKKNEQDANKLYGGGYAVDDIGAFNSQISPETNEVLAVNDPFNCQLTASYGRTDSQGIFELIFDLDKYVVDSGNAQEMALIPLMTAGKKINYTASTTAEFDLVVNAIYQGYIYNGQSEFRLPIRYDNVAKQFYNAETNQLLNTNPLVVEMELNDGSVPKLPIKLNVSGAKVLGSNETWTEYGTFVSLADKNAFPDSMIGISKELRIEFAYNATEYGTLQQNGVTLFFNNKTYPFSFKPSHDISLCAGSGQYYVDIPESHRLPAGQHIGRVDVVGATGDVTSIPFILTFTDAPNWIRDPELKNRHALIGWYSNPNEYFVHLSADVVPENDPNSSSQLGANVPKIGQLDNEAGANGRILQSITAAEFGQVTYEGAM